MKNFGQQPSTRFSRIFHQTIAKLPSVSKSAFSLGVGTAALLAAHHNIDGKNFFATATLPWLPILWGGLSQTFYGAGALTKSGFTKAHRWWNGPSATMTEADIVRHLDYTCQSAMELSAGSFFLYTANRLAGAGYYLLTGIGAPVLAKGLHGAYNIYTDKIKHYGLTPWQWNSRNNSKFYVHHF